MTRKTAQPLWRAILLDDDGQAVSFVLYANDADDAANQAEYQTGWDCVIVDDVSPTRRNVRKPGLLTVAS